MKLTNKKTSNCNRTTTTINQTTLNTTRTPLKILNILSTQLRSFNLGVAEFNRPEEREKLEIEAEIKRAQGRIYTSITPIR